MKEAPPARLNDALQAITRRAERLDPKTQAETYVALGGIENTLLNQDNRVIFGRRGTGKSHVIAYISDTVRKKGDLPVVIDLRYIGSNSYFYIDENAPIPERATRLLRDFISALHDSLLEQVTAPRSSYDVRRLSPLLDRLGASVKEVTVKEAVETKTIQQGSEKASSNVEGGYSISAAPSANGKGAFAQEQTEGRTREQTIRSKVRLSLNIGNVHRTLHEISDRLGKRVWLLIDEWSVLPEFLQPYLADFIKRSIFPNRAITTQIVAIEQRANFRVGSGADSFGIELGSDAFADVNLDDHLVFENNPQRSIQFFKELIYRHLAAVAVDARFKMPPSPDELLRLAFTQEPTFRELVRACEGVPRDAINILQIAATKAQDEKISMQHIRASAKDWYDRDKAAYIDSNTDAGDLLAWIMDKVIGERRARAFLVRSNVKNDILERLFDERILHIAKKSYSTKSEPGVRYKVWKLDYGCYVDLMNTSRAPTAYIFEGSEYAVDGNITVPDDDLRAIRRAVLNIDDFNEKKITARVEGKDAPAVE